MLQEIEPVFYRPPCWRRIAHKYHVNQLLVWVVLCSEQHSAKTVRELDQSSRVAGQESLIKLLHIPETHASFALWHQQLIPGNPMHFPLASFLTPPEFSYNLCKLLACVGRKFKDTHSIRGNGLRHRLYKDLLCRMDKFLSA
jgi:hypothetical protein